MYDIERKEKILEILRENKSCSVAFLAKTLCFSEATIRRDLNELDREMRLRKTFGGAVFLEKYGNEVPASLRKNENAEIKALLAKSASKLIMDGMTIFIASSTTTEYLLPYLSEHSGLTVITNSPDIPGKLSGTDVAVYSTGGKYLHHSNSYVGEFARNMIKGVNADLMFFSCRGVGEDGKVTISSTDDDVHRAMMDNSAKSCLMVDSSKFGKAFPFTITHINDVDVVVTDKAQPCFSEHGNVIVADEKRSI